MRFLSLMAVMLMVVPVVAQAFDFDYCSRLYNLGEGKFLCTYELDKQSGETKAKIYSKGEFSDVADGIYESHGSLPLVSSLLVDGGKVYYQTSGLRLKDNGKLSFFNDLDTQYAYRCDGATCKPAADGKYTAKSGLTFKLRNRVIDNGLGHSCQIAQRDGDDKLECEDRH